MRNLVIVAGVMAAVGCGRVSPRAAPVATEERPVVETKAAPPTPPTKRATTRAWWVPVVVVPELPAVEPVVVAAPAPIPVSTPAPVPPPPVRVIEAKVKESAEGMARRARYVTTCQQIIEEYSRNREVADEQYGGQVVLVSNVFVWSKNELADGRVVIRGRISGGIPSELVVYLDREDAGEAAGDLNAVLLVGVAGRPKGGAPVLEHARIVMNTNDASRTYAKAFELAGKR